MNLITRLVATPAPSRRTRVVERLMSDLSLEPAALERAARVAEKARQPLEQALNQMGLAPDAVLARAYAEVCGCPVWAPEAEPALRPPPDWVQPRYMEARRLLVIGADARRVRVAALDPLDDEGLAGLAFASGRTVDICVAQPADYRREAEAVYGSAHAGAPVEDHRLEAEVQKVVDVASDSDAARQLTGILEVAVARGASDIHFEPRRHDFRIRLRVDGQLVDFTTASVEIAAAVTSRIKVLANLDLGERRLPQDGRASFVVEGRAVECRVSVVPTVFGEAAVLRILDRVGVTFDLDALGVDGSEGALVRRALGARHGIFFVSGPTGSGKTTTLYALLNSLAGAQKKILSVEDPVEHHFAHVNQVQVAPQIGLTFASALRAFLRQDPDIILVGEVRDPETAGVAIQAALTGHLVLASVHANDAVRVAPRLLDMGVEPYQLAAALLGAAAQRLVRRLCPRCRSARSLTEPERVFAVAVANAAPTQAWEAIGCDACAGSGFRGRIALVEAFLCTETLAAAISHGAGVPELTGLARQSGLRSIAQDGVEKVIAGLTTFSEVMSALDG